MCHPETAGAAIRTRTARQTDGMAAKDGEGSQLTTHMPCAWQLEILRRPAAPSKVSARVASSAGASGRLRMTHHVRRRIQSLGVAIVSVLVFALPSPVRAVTLDRIAAVIDQQVLTVSEVDQMAEVRFIPRVAGRSDDDYHHDILEALIAQALRYRDVERFGAQDIPKDSIEARLVEIQHRFAAPDSLDASLLRAELTLDELRALIKRQLQVEAYIQERFAPLIFVANDDIAAYYNGPWRQQRVARGLAVPPLNDVREEIRTLIRSRQLEEQIATWTNQLRARANVDVYAWK